MGFSKEEYSPEIGIAVTHEWYPGEQFIFDFPKLMPQTVLDSHKSFLALKEEDEPATYRRALLETIGKLLLREPQGFDDFPGSSQVKAKREREEQLKQKLKPKDVEAIQAEIEGLDRQLASIRQTPLVERVVEYFDDPEKPELEAIIVSAWRVYRRTAMPDAYLKSLQIDGAGGSGLSAATGAGQT